MRLTDLSSRVFLVAVALLGAAGCGGPSSAGPDLSGAGSASAEVPSSTGAPTPEAGAGAGATAAPAGPPECKAADLSLSLAEDPGGAGMSHLGVRLRFANTSSRTCRLQGSPGVSFVAGDNGQQVGDPATRDPKSSGKVVVLRPTASTDALLMYTQAAAYDPADCRPVPARGLRVYAPDDTASMFVPWEQQACAAPGKVLLRVGVVGG